MHLHTEPFNYRIELITVLNLICNIDIKKLYFSQETAVALNSILLSAAFTNKKLSFRFI